MFSKNANGSVDIAITAPANMAAKVYLLVFESYDQNSNISGADPVTLMRDQLYCQVTEAAAANGGGGGGGNTCASLA